MLAVSIREFRKKSGEYLGKVAGGEEVVLRSRNKGSFRLTPMPEDDALMSKEEFFAKIDRAEQQAREGKIAKIVHNREELMAYLDGL
jgi:prevent-host-death family protein